MNDRVVTLWLIHTWFIYTSAHLGEDAAHSNRLVENLEHLVEKLKVLGGGWWWEAGVKPVGKPT